MNYQSAEPGDRRAAGYLVKLAREASAGWQRSLAMAGRRPERYAADVQNAVEVAVDKYIRAWSERDPLVRASLLEACFAAEGRMVQRSGETRGRAELAEMIESFIADPQWRAVRMTSAVDALGTTFRFRVSIDRHDGTSLDLFDAGEIDETGRIALILTFVDPLGEASG